MSDNWQTVEAKKRNAPLIIDPENIRCKLNPGAVVVSIEKMAEIKNALNKMKDRMDTMSHGEVEKRMTFSDPYDGVKHKLSSVFNAQCPTNAWLKYMEIMQVYGNSMFAEFRKNHQSESAGTSPVRVFCNAELPGSGICAINHYMQTNKIPFEWSASSILPGETSREFNYLDDDYGIMAKNPQNWLIKKGDSSFDGDVTSAAVRMHIHTLKKNNPADFYTSDLGFKVTDYNNQESAHILAHTAAGVIGLTSLAVGGSMFLKYYTFFEVQTIKFITLYLVPNFKRVEIFKPSSSRATNSEVYVVCIGLIQRFNFDEGEMILNDVIANDTPILSIPQSLYSAAEKVYMKQIAALRDSYSLILTKLPAKAHYNYNKLGIKKLDPKNFIPSARNI